MRLFLFILLLLSCNYLHAQMVTGVITDGRTGSPLFPVTVVNVNTQKSVYTDEAGNFSVPAKTGDKLLFTLVGYTTAEQYISADVFPKKLNIQLLTFSYQLDELIIRPNYTQYQFDSLHRRSVYSRTLAWKRTSTVMSPVSFIADRVSGKSRSRYAFQKNFNRWEDEKYVDTKYTPELVAQLTKLSGDSLAYFMNANPMPYDYARTATELELKMWVRFHYKEWMKNPVIPVIDTSGKTQTR